jgi:hypothetical protein
VCDYSDQAAHYHHLGPKLGASLLTRHIGWKQKDKVKVKLMRGWKAVGLTSKCEVKSVKQGTATLFTCILSAVVKSVLKSACCTNISGEAFWCQ